MVQNRRCGLTSQEGALTRWKTGGEGPKQKDTERRISPQKLCLHHPTPSCTDLSATEHHRKVKWDSVSVESELWDNSWKLFSGSKVVHKTASATTGMDVVQIPFCLSRKKAMKWLKLNTWRTAVREKHFFREICHSAESHPFPHSVPSPTPVGRVIGVAFSCLLLCFISPSLVRGLKADHKPKLRCDL